MRNVWRSVLVVLVLSSVVTVGQTPSTGATAPKDKALDLPLEKIEAVAREMAAMGVAGVVIDSFKARDIISTWADQSQVSRLDFIVDALRALKALGDNPRRISNCKVFVS